MSEVIILRDSYIIATEINIIKNQTAQVVLLASIDIGKRLTEAKNLVAHGEWQNWLAESVDYKQSTANNLMRIAKKYENSSDKLKAISYSQAVALLSLDEADREEFVEQNNVDEMSVRELQEAIKAKEEAEHERDEYKDEILKISSLASESKFKVQEAEDALSLAEQVSKDLQKTIDDVKSKNKKLEENLKSEKQELLDKIAKLEAEKDVISAEVVLPDEELEKIRQEEATKYQELIEVEKDKIFELEKKLKKTTNTNIVEFKLYFENTQNTFNKMMGCVDKIIAENDVETANKLKGALTSLLAEFNKVLSK